MNRDDRTSMLLWYPLIKDLAIPQPKTTIIPLSKEVIKEIYNEHVPEELAKKVAKVDYGIPFFLRTDYASGKHDWETSCFVNSSELSEIQSHIWRVIEFNLMADMLGLPFKALVVREYIPMDGTFVAFWGKLPINSERRYFIRNKKVECHHPYWVEPAIAEASNWSPKNWRTLLKKLNTETVQEIQLLTGYSEMVGKAVGDEYWSVDFCRGKNGTWYLIDMAEGERSYHPPCKNAPKEKGGE